MKEIPLSQGLVAFVDDEDFDRVSAFKWSAVKTSPTRTYAIRRVNGVGIYMHRFILGLADPTIKPDHRDGNGLNNQKDNLRIATTQSNAANAQMPITNTSGFKGVSFDRMRKTFRSTIKMNGRQKFLGRFPTAEEAARAYDAAAIAAFGEFARVNFVGKE